MLYCLLESNNMSEVAYIATLSTTSELNVCVVRLEGDKAISLEFNIQDTRGTDANKYGEGVGEGLGDVDPGEWPVCR
jgi:hypothetical protein